MGLGVREISLRGVGLAGGCRALHYASCRVSVTATAVVTVIFLLLREQRLCIAGGNVPSITPTKDDFDDAGFCDTMLMLIHCVILCCYGWDGQVLVELVYL